MGVKVKITFEGKEDDDKTIVASWFETLDSEGFTEWIEKIKPLEKEGKDNCDIKGFARSLKGES